MDYRRAFGPFAALLVVALADSTAPVVTAAGQDERKKPSVSLKVTPPIAFSPAKVRVVAEIRGGDDDYQEYYCPTVEWDWGDGTLSENTEDCNPYEAGKTTIRRRFSTDHTYRTAGNYKVFFRLKRKDKVVGAASASVQVRPGLRDQL